ncbi:aldehyde dehydrogenase family protein [Kineococcus esterisolvens]|uniref:aldehyde dehydrogenase family protein n=1 Tax=unclassified Kineococcus TaxID=2621656 RepID=UPI003D7D6B70
MTSPLPEAAERAPRHLRAQPGRAQGPPLEDAAAAGLPGELTATGGDGTSPRVDVPRPATGERLLAVADTSHEVLSRVLEGVVAASRAEWAWLSGEDRARHLFTLADVLADHVHPLAVTRALTTGRPVAAGLAADGPQLLDAAFSTAGWADKLDALGAEPGTGGAVAVLATWRSGPAALVTAVAAALAAGAGALLRPDPQSAATAERLVRACSDAGLPAGLVATAPGCDPVADAVLWEAEGLLAVRADGTAERLHELALDLADRGTPLVADHGTTAVDVVLEGADLDAVVPALLAGLTDGAHTRPGGSRVLVVEPLAEALVARLDAGAAALRPGDPLDRTTRVGPCPTPAVARAAAAVAGGGTPPGLPAGGWWAAPAVVATGRRTLPPPPGPVLGVRTVRAGTDPRTLLEEATAVTVWGPSGPERRGWLAGAHRERLGLDSPAGPDARLDAQLLLRACGG